MNLFTKQKYTHGHRKQTWWLSKGKGGEGINWGFGINRYILLYIVSSLVVQSVKNPPATQEMGARSLGREDPLKKEMLTHSSIVA